jgi:Origin of replication binding protein
MGALLSQWSDMFVGEDSVTRAFEDFREGEMIRHQHEGRRGVENSASAVVYDGCFFCFVCQKTYYVASTLLPDTYLFLPSEIHQRDKAGAFLPPPDLVDWSELLGRQFLAISSPMGTGKTTWLAYLCKVGACQDALVCVVMHRMLLGLQIAQKCGLANYLDKLNWPLTTEEIERIGAWVLEDVRRVAVVLNSLWRVGDAWYKVLIMDEAWLVRRHFVSRTLGRGTQAMDAFDKLKRLVGRADNVVLLQEDLEHCDVGFYTTMHDIDPEDRCFITVYKMEKPIQVHDILWWTDVYDILGHMLDKYTEMAAASQEEGKLEWPFVILSSSLAFANALYELLLERALTNVQRGRICLVTSRQRTRPQGDFDKTLGWSHTYGGQR